MGGMNYIEVGWVMQGGVGWFRSCRGGVGWVM